MTLGLLVASENDNTQRDRQTRFMFYKYRYYMVLVVISPAQQVASEPASDAVMFDELSAPSSKSRPQPQVCCSLFYPFKYITFFYLLSLRML